MTGIERINTFNFRTDVITDEVVRMFRDYDDYTFYHAGIEEVSPDVDGPFYKTPLYQFLHRCLDSDVPLNGPSEFKSPHERALLDILYQKTSGVIIWRNPNIFVSSLNRSLASEEFGLSMIQNVSDTNVFHDHASDIAICDIRLFDNIFERMLLIDYDTHDHSESEISDYVAYHTMLADHMLKAVQHPSQLLLGPDSKTPTLNKYLSYTNGITYQYYVPWFIEHMTQHKIPFVGPPNSECAYGPLYTLVESYIKTLKGDNGMHNDTFRIDNIQRVFDALSPEDRSTMNARGKTALDIALMYYEETNRNDILHIINILQDNTHCSKNANC